MNVFVAGASGAIGKPLITELVRRGHAVTGMTRSETGASTLREHGAAVAEVDALDAWAVERAVRSSRADVLINQLTALPKDPRDMLAAAQGDRRLRLDGGGNLYHAAKACGVQRYMQQSSAFYLQPGDGLADESVSFVADATPFVAAGARTYAELESRVFSCAAIEGVALRYGFFYGPQTWYHPQGAAAEQVRRREIPIIGAGRGVWSWVHIEDAAIATADAMTAPPGIYHIVDDDPSPVQRWLPAFARWVGAPPPDAISEADAEKTAGPDAVYYGTRLRGASNQKAKATLGFRPRRLQWLDF